MVAQEFHDLKRHSERTKSCKMCVVQEVVCTHPQTLRERLFEFKQKSTLKPFFIAMSIFFLVQFAANFSLRPYFVQIFKAYKSPIGLDKAVAVMSILDNLSNLILILFVRFIGKRMIFLVTTFGVFISTAVLSCYGFIYLPRGFTSFNQSEESDYFVDGNLNYIPFVCMILWSFFVSCGMIPIPWMLLSEIFPFK